VRRNALQPIDFGALRIFDYSAGKNFDASVAVIEVPPKARHAEAWSKRSDKYYLVMQGELRFVVEGNASDLAAGDFCFVPHGQRFSYSNDSAKTAVLVLVHTPSFRLEDEVFV
jgi:mannose-6-phosphate isomerase-like protein (cupin superfamily)